MNRGSNLCARWFVSALTLLLALGPIQALADVLTYAVSPSNKPPFWFKEAGRYKGIMVDVAHELANELGHTIKIAVRPPRRGQLKTIMAPDHKPTIHFSNFAIEWVATPEKYHFTEPVAQVNDILLSHVNNPVKVRQLEELPKYTHSIGTHRGYIYPALGPLFQKGALIREDATSELAIIKKLLYQRNSVSVVSYEAMAWYSNKHNFTNQFYVADYVLASASLRYVFRGEDGALAKAFDEGLARMKASGRLQSIVKRYIPADSSPVLPKRYPLSGAYQTK